LDETPHAERYRGKPLLILLENYALAVIGEMPANQKAGVAAQVAESLGGEASDWKATVRRAAGPADRFRHQDSRGLAVSAKRASPLDFVIAISDANFVDLMDAG
jgi:hypothetical protein